MVWNSAKRVVCCVLLALMAGTSTVAVGQDDVAARVGATPITRRQIDAGVPPDAYARRARNIRERRLTRLIELEVTRQFLEARGVRPARAAIDARLAKLRKLPPAQLCPCCRFPSLEAFLETESITLLEMKAQIRNEIGLETLVLTSWKQTYPGGRGLKIDRPRMEREWMRGGHLFFNTSRLLSAGETPASQAARARKLSEECAAALRAGSGFETTARKFSEDPMSRDQGGDLGLFRRDAYGPEFADALKGAAAGQIVGPFRSQFGIHIARWVPFKPADFKEIAFREFAEKKTVEIKAAATKAIPVQPVGAAAGS